MRKVESKAFATYDLRNKLFRTDEISDLDKARHFRVASHLGPEVDYIKAYEDHRYQFNMMIGEMIVQPKHVEWAKQVFDEGRKNGCPDSEIAGWIRAYAKEKNFSSLAINYLLLKNDVRA